MLQSYQLSTSRGRLAPATLAIMIQISAFIAVFLTVCIVSYFSTVRFSLWTLVLLQSLAATTLCHFVSQAIWWRWIHALFPFAVWIMSLWAVPNEVYLIGFIVSLSIFWTTFRSQVPFFPSRPIVWEKVAGLIPQDKPIHMIDIGSGLGDLSMHVAKARLNSQVEGIEIAPLPWLVSVVRAWIRRSPAQFTLGNYHELDFTQYDLVFAYLSPAAMPALWEKAQKEMASGSLLVSYEFDIPDESPTFTIENGPNKPTIFVWQL